MSEHDENEIDAPAWPMHLKVQAWAADKTTGLIPAMIVPSIHMKPEEAAEGFATGGKFDVAYQAFKAWYEKNNPKVKWIGA